MWFALGFAIVLLILILFEIRIKKPDQIVLAESGGNVIQRKGRFYPRHFSLAVPGTIYSLAPEFESDAKGKLAIQIKLAVACAASLTHLNDLIRVGGWDKKMVSKAAQELSVILHSKIKEFTEKYGVEELSSELLAGYLRKQIGKTIPELGLDIVTLNVQSIEPVDKDIAEAMQQRESARINEQTELANQQTRISTAKARFEADETIARSEHKLELKRFELKKVEQEKEAEIARQRLAEELERRKMHLELDSEEINLIKNNPELLLLTPQVARLAEASQNLKNARTVVSLSPGDAAQGSQIFSMIQSFLQNMMQAQPQTPNKNNKTD